MKVTRKEGESAESLVRRFRRKVIQSGFLTVARKKQFYEKPLTKREKREIALRKKFRSELRKKRLMRS